MKIYLESLGCCRNQVDSEVMLGRLDTRGHEISFDPSEAEVIIVNTCGFIDAASAEAIDTILEMAAYKIDTTPSRSHSNDGHERFDGALPINSIDTRPDPHFESESEGPLSPEEDAPTGQCRRLIVTGCLPERFRDDTISEALPEVDAFLGTGACDQIIEAVEGIGPYKALPNPITRQFQGHPLPRQLTLNYSAYLKISEGCNRHCTYCIIPKLRGKQRSRPIDAVVNETTHLLDHGVKEIILVGENTTDYGTDLLPPQTLSHLLDEISHATDQYAHENREPGSRPGVSAPSHAWIRLLYTHPTSITDDVIRAVATHSNICTYYDIPVQHASTPVLKRMGRGYTQEDLYRLFENIRNIAPDATLRTTLITGFPGETDSDFETLLKFIQDIRFDHLGVFPYSDSDDLSSHHLKNHVNETLAQERHDILMNAQAMISEENNQKYLHQTLTVLVEENPDEGIYLGRTRFQAPEVDGLTFIYGSGLEIGTFAEVKITETHEYDLAGNAVLRTDLK